MSTAPVREEDHQHVDAAVAETAEASGASVDKIRDILFGSQIKNYEARFSRLEEALVRETAEVKDTLHRRLESLEAFFKKETESLAARLKTEREARDEVFNEVSRELKAVSAQLSKRISELDNKAAEDRSSARQELMAESRKIFEEIRQRNDSLSALLETRVRELNHAKTDRSALAALLVEVAVRLRDEGEAPDKAKPKPIRSATPA
jgi:DNA anti-recombination protein RmuC